MFGQAIPDRYARARNVRLLVEDLPWSHQPLLLALADLLSTLLAPDSSTELGSSEDGPSETTDHGRCANVPNAGTIAVRDAVGSLAPALLRPPTDAVESGWEEELAAVSVVELMLSDDRAVMDGLRTERADRWALNRRRDLRMRDQSFMKTCCLA